MNTSYAQFSSVQATNSLLNFTNERKACYKCVNLSVKDRESALQDVRVWSSAIRQNSVKRIKGKGGRRGRVEGRER